MITALWNWELVSGKRGLVSKEQGQGNCGEQKAEGEGTTLLCQQSPFTGVPELLGQEEWMAALTEHQQAEALMVVFRGVVDLLENGPLQVRVLQQVCNQKLLHHKLILFAIEMNVSGVSPVVPSKIVSSEP